MFAVKLNIAVTEDTAISAGRGIASLCLGVLPWYEKEFQDFDQDPDEFGLAS